MFDTVAASAGEDDIVNENLRDNLLGISHETEKRFAYLCDLANALYPKLCVFQMAVLWVFLIL